MSEKRGPGRPRKGDKAKYHTFAMAVDEERKEKIYAAGTADFWRPVITAIADYKLALGEGEITEEKLEEYEKRILSAVRTHAIEFHR